MDTFWVYTSVRDEEHLMPFFLRHYLDYADKVIVQDCGSTDQTKAMVRDAGAELIETQPWGMDELRRREESVKFVQEAKGSTAWVACVDADEFLIGDFDLAFQEADQFECDVLQTIGWTMLCPEFPKDDGGQIYEICDLGVNAGAAKPCLARAGAKFYWSSGRHFVESPGTRIHCSRINLLHYRYLGVDYTRSRNDKNWRNSEDKGTAWACAPDWKGPGSPQDVAEGIKSGKPIMSDLVKTFTEPSVVHWHKGYSVMIR